MRRPSRRAGCGGLLRDETGIWISEFSCNLGMCTPLVAEHWAMLHGLELAWDKGCRNLQIEVDSKSTIQVFYMNIQLRGM